MVLFHELSPGDALGRYEVLLRVARGGMAEVWAARIVGTRGFQKLVAIKTMLPALADDGDFETMFLDEGRLAARIRHPHVAEIIDLGEDRGLLYLVMEWVDGETLSVLNKRAKARGGIPVPVLLRIASEACAGLHAAHELRDEHGRPLDLVHRDVSPQNVMISSGGIVKVVDFGVAKAAGRAHETRVSGLMKGKVPYLSPEQLQGGKVDRRADVFSLGVLLYVMVTGRHPFRGETDAATIENIVSRAPVPPRELAPRTPPDLAAIIVKALEKDPGARFEDAAAMQRALDQTLAGLGAIVTDDDVAAYVRETVGDAIDERKRLIAAAVEQTDARASARPGARRTSSRPASGRPLPATYDGILPVSLEEPPRVASAGSSSTPPAPIVPASPSRRRPRAAWIAGACVVGLGAAGALLVHAGSGRTEREPAPAPSPANDDSFADAASPPPSLSEPAPANAAPRGKEVNGVNEAEAEPAASAAPVETARVSSSPAPRAAAPRSREAARPAAADEPPPAPAATAQAEAAPEPSAAPAAHPASSAATASTGDDP